MLLRSLALLSAASFFYFGTACLVSARLRREYDRYGLADLRVVTGVLQLLGAVGLVVGLRLTPVGVLAATGLSALMLLGVGVRRRIHDSVLQTLPAAGLAALNALLVVLFLGR